jgi:hypothetical protein
VASLQLGNAQSAKQYLTQASKGQPNGSSAFWLLSLPQPLSKTKQFIDVLWGRVIGILFYSPTEWSRSQYIVLFLCLYAMPIPLMLTEIWITLFVTVTDTNVRMHLQQAEDRLSTEYQKEKALYRGMFSSSQRAGEGASGGVTQK